MNRRGSLARIRFASVVEKLFCLYSGRNDLETFRRSTLRETVPWRILGAHHGTELLDFLRRFALVHGRPTFTRVGW